MRARVLLLGVVLAGLALASCQCAGPCDPATCNGCCRGGACVDGQADDACGAGAQACTSCADQGQVCRAGFCLDPSLATGRDCSAPIEVTLTAGSASLTGDTRGGSDAVVASCGGQGASELIYRLVNPQPATLQFEVRPTDAALRPVVSLRPDCDAPAETSPGCVAAAVPGGGAALAVPNAPAGVYALVVDGADGTEGAFTLTVTRQVGGGESCTSPLPLNFPLANETVLASTLQGAAPDTQALCGGSGPDLTWRFATGRAFNVDVEVQADSPAARPVVYLRSACSGGEVTCGAAPQAGDPALAWTTGLPLGTHHLFVDSAVPEGGAFVARARLLLPPPGAGCLNPLSVSLDAGALQLQGSLPPPDGGVQLGTNGSCGGAPGQERVYTFTSQATRNLSAVMTAAPDAGLVPVLYLRSGLCGGAERRCAVGPANGAARLDVGSLPAGTWYLFADGDGSGSGDFSLDVSLTPVPDGDSCGRAEPLATSDGADGGNAALTATLQGYQADTAFSCGGSGLSPDRVYALTLGAPRNLVARLAPQGPDRLLLGLRSFNCASTEVACGPPDADGGASLRVGGLGAGTHYLWVDTQGPDAGAYDLAVELLDPALGDGCSAPLPLALSDGLDGGSAVATGSTVGAFHDVPTLCAGTGPDRVYAFTTGRATQVSAQLRPTTPGYQPVLLLKAVCTSGSLRTCRQAASAGATASLGPISVAAGTWFLVVDGAAGTAGDYELTVTAQ